MRIRPFCVFSLACLFFAGCGSKEHAADPPKDHATDPAEQFKDFVSKATNDLYKTNQSYEEFSIGREKQDVSNMKVTYEFAHSENNSGLSATLHIEIHNVRQTPWFWTYTFNYDYKDKKWVVNNVEGIQVIGMDKYILPKNIMDCDDAVKCFTP
jgi:hypothetical protein